MDQAKMDHIEWAVDCLKSRMDAVDRERADADRGRREPPAYMRPNGGLIGGLARSREAFGKQLEAEGPEKEPPTEKEAPSSTPLRKIKIL